jgi:hypothetical protein
MLARTVHHLLITEALVWLVEEIERSLKGFFWREWIKPMEGNASWRGTKIASGLMAWYV